MAVRRLIDRPVLGLVAANVIAIGIALASGMGLREMLLVYWMQNVIIGIAFFFRMVKLERFSNDVATPDESRGAARVAHIKAALVFAFFYVTFHLMYIGWIAYQPRFGPYTGSILGFLSCTAAFALSHAYSLRESMQRDRLGTPSLRTMMTLPILRILPMHLTILAGVMTASSMRTFVFFATVKTLVDVLMELMERRMLVKGNQPA